MPKGTVIKKLVVAFLLALILAGCATTYVPISWDLGDRVRQLTRSDLTLAILFERYDPQRLTLRIAGDSFDEVMMPSEVKHHLGAYRRDKKLIYRNLYQSYTDAELRDLLVHEFAHHIWFSFLNPKQRLDWGRHLGQHPSPLQDMVRSTYSNPEEFAAEDFAFTVEYARSIDLEKLWQMTVITQEECQLLLAERRRSPHPTLEAGKAVVTHGAAALSQSAR
jgi:hypothetical protein